MIETLNFIATAAAALGSAGVIAVALLGLGAFALVVWAAS